MNIWLFILPCSIMFLFTLVFESKKITPVFIAMVSLIEILIGQYEMDVSQGSTHIWWLYFLSIFFFLMGYFLFKFLDRNKNREIKKVSYAFKAESHLTQLIFVGFIVIGVLYHFIAGGIPLFSSSIEVDRFDFSSSGLFGIPGRIFLFGLPFILIYISYYHHLVKNKYTFRLLLAVWIIFIIFKILSGFKGSIVEIVTFFIFIRAIVGKPISVKKLVSFRFILAVAAAVIFAGVMTSHYASLSIKGYSQTLQYLLARLTELPAEPSNYILNHLSSLTGNGQMYLYNEWLYFLQKYFHLNLTNGHLVFPIDKVISSIIYNVPLSDNNFIVPVTVGAFGDLALDFGLIGSFLLLFIVGGIFYWLFDKCNKATTPFKGATVGLILYELNIYLTNGGLIYLILNLFVMIILIGCLYLFAKLIARIIVGAVRNDVPLIQSIE